MSETDPQQAFVPQPVAMRSDPILGGIEKDPEPDRTVYAEIVPVVLLPDES